MKQSKSIKVSIITPIYGVEKYIEKCVRSLLEQDYENIEYIFVDDRTKDNSINILKNIIQYYPDRINQIKIISHQTNKGLSAARETGIQNSTGEYLIHVDSDDFVEKNIISLCIKKVINNQPDMVITGTIHEYKNNKSKIDYSTCKYANKDQYLKDVIKQNIPTCIWGKLIKRSLYINNEIHCLSNISFGEDYAVLPKLLFYAKNLEIVHTPLYHYTHYNDNSFTQRFKWSNVHDIFYVENNINDFFQSKSIYKKELHIARLKRIAWVIRYTYENNANINKAQEIYKEYEILSESFKDLTTNQRIILWLDSKGYKLMLKFFIKYSRRILNFLSYYN